MPMVVPVFTAVLGQSGSKDVDNYALDVAGRARFQPLRRSRAPGVPPPENLAWVSFVFQWHTIPMPVTNPAVVLPLDEPELRHPHPRNDPR